MGTKRKYVQDDFDLEVKAEAKEDKQEREEKEKIEMYKAQRKKYKQEMKVYQQKRQLFMDENEGREPDEDDLPRPTEPKALQKKRESGTIDATSRESLFNQAQGRGGLHLRVADGRKLLRLLELECKTDASGHVEVICPNRFLKEERENQIQEMKARSSIISPVKSEPPFSRSISSLRNGIKNQSAVKSEGGSIKNGRSDEKMDLSSHSFDTVEGAPKEITMDSDSDSEEEIILGGGITSFSRAAIKKESDSESDDGIVTAAPVDLRRFQRKVPIKEEDEDSEDELPPPNPVLFLSKRSKEEILQEEAKLKLEPENENEALAEVPKKTATVSASDRSPHEHRPSWPCTPEKKFSEPISLDSIHSIPGPMARFLRNYQVEGARFLFNNFISGTGALLGDDMGTGKTVQTLAFLMAIMLQTGYAKEDEDRRSKECTRRRREGEKKIDPLSIGPTCLLIVPATVIQNWKNEIKTWTYLNAIEFGTENRDGLRKYKSGEFDILIVSHEYARDHIDELVSPSTNFSTLVIDEAHKFKNPKSTLTQAYHRFKEGTVRFGLTGTAVQNDFVELWCLLDLLNPCSLGYGNKAWETLVSDPIKDGMKKDSTPQELNNKAVVIDAVRNKILSKVYLRRTKEIIKDDLPQKFLHVLFCKMTPLQNEAYDRALKDYNDNSLCKCGSKWPSFQRKLYRHCCGLPLGEETPQNAEDAEGKHWFIYYHILTAIANHVGLLLPEKKPTSQMKPMDVARNHKRLEYLKMSFGGQNMVQMTNNLRENSADYCGKWAALEKLLARFHRDGDKVLLFSSRLASLQYVEHLADRQDYNHLTLQGSTPANQRQGLCDEFNNDPNAFLFLIATKAGGTGLNLTGANRVIIFDPSPNPAHDNQAIDRAFRLGQMRDVSVHKLISSDSVEKTMYERQVYKEMLSQGILDAKVHVSYWDGKKGHDPQEYGSHLWGLQNLLQRPSSSTKTLAAEGHHVENIKEVDAFLDNPEVKFDDDEDEHVGLRSIAEDEAQKKDQTLASVGVEDHQDHLDLMAATEAVDIETLKDKILGHWNSSKGTTESPFAKREKPSRRRRSGSPDEKPEVKSGRKEGSSNSKSNQAASSSNGKSASSSAWAPPSRGGNSTVSQPQSTGLFSARAPEEIRRELSELLKSQASIRNRPDAEELLAFIAEKEGLSMAVLDSVLRKNTESSNKKLFSKYDKLFQQAKEL